MCEPVTIATIALTVAQSAVQYDSTRRAANQQADATRANFYANDAATQVQQNQMGEQASQQMSERGRQAMIERGKLRAIQADTGVGGNSDERGFAAINYAENTDMATLTANRDNSVAQAQRNKQSGLMQANNALGAIQQPSLLGAGLQIAGGSLDAYSRYKAGTPANKAQGGPAPFESGYPG